MNLNTSIKNNYLALPVFLVLAFLVWFFLRPKSLEATTEQISSDAIKKDATEQKKTAETFPYQTLPQKTRAYYLAIANAIYTKLDKMTFLDRDVKPFRQKIVQEVIDVFKSSSTSQNSKYSAKELEAIYCNFGVRTVNAGTTDYTGNLNYFINLWGSSEQISEFKYLFRFTFKF